ncbi:hypothetical protein IEQ34_000445 [Dendrobium chrysotoxum]|uniref:Uncharacterized protein n=1 Tax=Dendrobium chrysotoxum TaxID=161865 RepID=A0AAV7HQH9_DENCH|nr:hypothetical protein IEQ34_000445 [Dendrobium chrysotoxum]
MEVVGNNLYEPRDNPSLAFEMEKDHTNGVGFDRNIRTKCAAPGGDEFARGDGRVLCGCQARAFSGVGETNETIVKKPKMEEGPIHYCLQVIPTVFIGPKGYCYAYIMSC